MICKPTHLVYHTFFSFSYVWVFLVLLIIIIYLYYRAIKLKNETIFNSISRYNELESRLGQQKLFFLYLGYGIPIIEIVYYVFDVRKEYIFFYIAFGLVILSIYYLYEYYGYFKKSFTTLFSICYLIYFCFTYYNLIFSKFALVNYVAIIVLFNLLTF